MQSPSTPAKEKSVSSMSDTDTYTTIINSHSLKRVLLSDGWHDISDCEFTYFSVGSSPQSSYRDGLRFKDNKTGQTYIVNLSMISAYEGGDF